MFRDVSYNNDEASVKKSKYFQWINEQNEQNYKKLFSYVTHC